MLTAHAERRSLSQFTQVDAFRADFDAKSLVMLHEHQRGAVFEDRFFYLYARKNVYVVKRLIPQIKMGAFAEAFGYNCFLFLTGAEILHVLVELLPAEIEFAEYRLKESFIDPAGKGERRQTAAQI